MIQVRQIFEELKATHLRLTKLNCSKRQDSDYYVEISNLEEKQRILSNQLKSKGWVFNYELIKMEKLNE